MVRMLPCHGRGRGFESRPVRRIIPKYRDFFMTFFVYIIQSLKDGTYYKGSTENYLQRFSDHNAGKSRYTSSKIPWKLIYVEELADKKTMLIREKKFKHCKADYFEWLVLQTSNLVGKR